MPPAMLIPTSSADILRDAINEHLRPRAEFEFPINTVDITSGAISACFRTPR
jgi:hypothetical protein